MNNTPDLLAALRREMMAVQQPEELLPFIGACAAMRDEAQALYLDLRAAQRANGAGRATPADDDTLLTPEEVAQRLNVSERYVRKHAKDFGRVQLGPHTVRYSSSRIAAAIRRKSHAQ